MILKSFSSFDCYLFPFPIENGIEGKTREETLQQIETVEFEQLNPRFRDNMSALCTHIQTEIMPKKVNGTHMSVNTFVAYIEKVVEKINNNERVNMMNSFLESIEFAYNRSLEDAIEVYITRMSQVRLPARLQAIMDKHAQLFNECSNELESNLNGKNNMTETLLEK